jgi:ATP-dependent Zn protease
MVGSFGMAGSLISYDLMAGPPGAGVVAKVLSSEEGKEAVSEILERSKTEVTRLLGDHRNIIEALRDALLDRDELIGQEIVDVIQRAELHALGMIEPSVRFA